MKHLATIRRFTLEGGSTSTSVLFMASCWFVFSLFVLVVYCVCFLLIYNCYSSFMCIYIHRFVLFYRVLRSVDITVNCTLCYASYNVVLCFNMFSVGCISHATRLIGYIYIYTHILKLVCVPFRFLWAYHFIFAMLHVS